MLSVEQLRKIDPDLNKLSDEEVLQVRDIFYDLGQIIYEDYSKKEDSKNPVGVLRGLEKGSKLKYEK